MDEMTCHICEFFFQEDKILLGGLPLLSKLLSFYLTVPLLACLLWVQRRTPVPNFTTSFSYCLTDTSPTYMLCLWSYPLSPHSPSPAPILSQHY